MTAELASTSLFSDRGSFQTRVLICILNQRNKIAAGVGAEQLLAYGGRMICPGRLSRLLEVSVFREKRRGLIVVDQFAREVQD